jgi:2-methylisocitrate lyase-like PEP mutase family enzyme
MLEVLKVTSQQFRARITMVTATQNELAKKLKALHVPGKPLVLTNVYDAATAAIVCAHPATKAVATASYAIAATSGVEDDDLTLSENLSGIQKVAKVVNEHPGLPLTVDLQDGYDIESAIPLVIEVGAVGCNIEDFDHEKKTLRTKEDAVRRITQVLSAATEAGVPDFCVNARTDVLKHGGSVQDAIDRGKAYLAAGANTIFVMGGTSGVSGNESKQLVAGLDGKINIMTNLRPGFLGVKDLSEIGVARISVGPALYRAAMKGFSDALDRAVT